MHKLSLHALILLTGLFAIGGCSQDWPMSPPATAPRSEMLTGSSRAPLTETISVPFTFADPCPQGFTLVNSGRADIRQTIFFDRLGTPVRTQAHFHLRATIMNTSTGKSLRNNADFTVFDLVTGVTEVVGKAMILTDRGKGIIVQDAGKITFDAEGNVIFEAGVHDLQNGDAPSLQCENLA
jgi:hypothetical protein